MPSQNPTAVPGTLERAGGIRVSLPAYTKLQDELRQRRNTLTTENLTLKHRYGPLRRENALLKENSAALRIKDNDTEKKLETTIADHATKLAEIDLDLERAQERSHYENKKTEYSTNLENIALECAREGAEYEAKRNEQLEILDKIALERAGERAEYETKCQEYSQHLMVATWERVQSEAKVQEHSKNFTKVDAELAQLRRQCEGKKRNTLGL